MSSHVEELRSHFTRMYEMAEWGKQSHHHGMVSMAFRIEALGKIAEAALDEHASHFEQYKEDKDGCATCYYIYKLIR